MCEDCERLKAINAILVRALQQRKAKPPPPVSGGGTRDTCVDCVGLRAINAAMLNALRHVMYWSDTGYVGGIDWRNVANAIAAADTPAPVSGGSPDDPMAFPRKMTRDEGIAAWREAWDFYRQRRDVP